MLPAMSASTSDGRAGFDAHAEGSTAEAAGGGSAVEADRAEFISAFISAVLRTISSSAAAFSSSLYFFTGSVLAALAGGGLPPDAVLLLASPGCNEAGAASAGEAAVEAGK